MAHDPLQPLLDGVTQLNLWAGELTGLDFADERGWLDDDGRARFRDLDAQFRRVRAELDAQWQALPAEAIARHDARVERVLARIRAAGRVLDNFHLQTLGPAATATRAPQRKFDFWAIWAIHKIDPDG